MPNSVWSCSFFKKLWLSLLSIVVLFVSLFGSVTKVSAQAETQTTTSNPASYYLPSTDPDVPADQHTMIQSLSIEMLSSGICLLSGIDLMNPNHSCLTINPATQKIGYAKSPEIGGAIGLMTNQISLLYTPPASSSDYGHYLSSRFGLTSHVFAAEDSGNGFTSLRPLLGLWLVSRNLSFMFMVVAFITIGFAIMIRFKIDPRTVMSIQSQIPKIIIAILLITFSYSIVGVMVDVMWVGTYGVINLITSPSIGNIDSQTATSAILDNPVAYFQNINQKDEGSFDGILGLTKDAAGDVGDLIRSIIGNLLGIDNPQCNFGDIFKGVASNIPVIGGLIGATHGHEDNIGECGKVIVNSLIFGLSSFIGFFVALIAIFVSLFRIWVMLLKAYMYILFDAIVAPLWIVVGLFPGSTYNASSWFRHLAAHLLVFPAATAMFLIAKVVTVTFTKSNQNIFLPPLIGNGNVGSNIAALAGIAILFIMPEILQHLRDAVKAPQAKKNPIIAGFQAGFAPVAGVGTGVKGTLWKTNPTTHAAEGILNAALASRIATGRVRNNATTPTWRTRLVDRWFGEGRPQPSAGQTGTSAEASRARVAAAAQRTAQAATQTPTTPEETH